MRSAAIGKVFLCIFSKNFLEKARENPKLSGSCGVLAFRFGRTEREREKNTPKRERYPRSAEEKRISLSQAGREPFRSLRFPPVHV